MTRSDYLANSSKLLLICSCFLFVVNSLSLFGMYSDALSDISSKLVSACFYVVLVFGFLAFNGEGIAYKHSRQRSHKKKTVILKIILLSAFLIRFVKTPLESFGMGVDAQSFLGAITRFGLGVLNTVASYGFLLTCVALWYVFRDIGSKKLIIPEVLAFLSGLIYNAYRVVNYSVTKFEFTYFGDVFNEIFSNGLVLNILCLVHFATDIIMFAIVLKYYNTRAITEQDEKTAITRQMVTSRKIYNTDCFGLDTMEDDFLLEKSGETSEI